MASIVRRRRADGSMAYRADIRIKRGGKIIYQESQTFSREALANDWARRREVELEAPGALQKAQQGALTVGALLQQSIDELEKIGGWGRSKKSDMRRLLGASIAALDAPSLTSQQIIAYALDRRRAGAGPATVLNDLVWLASTLRTAKVVWGYPVDPTVVDEARTECIRQRLVGRSRRRDRRPTSKELEQLDDYFRRRDDRAEIPMVDVMWFAIRSSRREAEITRLEWVDQDKDNKTGLVRDAKHPRKKDGNHRRFKYTDAAWMIAERQPKTGPLIFPYNPKSIGAAFTRACKVLGIADLHFHDLRHDATSRLFEAGHPIHEVAMFTLHESWDELKRYAQLDPGKIENRPAQSLAVIASDQHVPTP